MGVTESSRAPSGAALRERYPLALVRDGAVHPVAVTPWPAPLATATETVPPEPLDATLLAWGRPHLDALLATNPHLYDGPVLRWVETTPTALRLAPGRYFDAVRTCEAVRAEWLRAADGGHPLRDRVHELAGDPFRSGRGRAAALGASVVVTHPAAAGDPDPVFVLGLRSGANAADVGVWHVAPSGMVEPDGDGADPLTATVATELSQELGLDLPAAEIRRRASVLGIVHDLLRLRPDVVIRLPLTAEEGAALAPGPEFGEITRVQTSTAAFADFWRRWPPSRLTPPAAGAIALLETALHGPLREAAPPGPEVPCGGRAATMVTVEGDGG